MRIKNERSEIRSREGDFCMSSELAIAPSRPGRNPWAWADVAGLTASIGCAIHCAAMPLVFAYLPALGLGWLAGEGFHRYMAILCFLLALTAFLPGWRSHKSLVPMGWGLAGLILINTTAFGLEEGCCPSCHASGVNSAEVGSALCEFPSPTGTESTTFLGNTGFFAVSLAKFVPFVTPLGGLLLVVGHVVNHHKRCRCHGDRCCQDPAGAEFEQELAAK